MGLGKRLLLVLLVHAAAWNGPALAKERVDAPKMAIHMARQLEGRGDISGAMALYRSVLEVSPDHVEALEGAAGLLLARGFAAAAYDYLEPLTVLRPKDGTVRLALAQALNAMERPDEALAALAVAQTLKAAPRELALETGIAEDLRGNARVAQGFYARALAVVPADARMDRIIERRLALSLALSGDYTAALQLLKARLAPGQVPDSETAQAVALTQALAGDVETALMVARSALPAATAETLRPLYVHLASLTPAQAAVVVHFNRLPAVNPHSARLALAPLW